MRGWRDVLKWKLTSRPQPSPRFVADVNPVKPPRCVEGDDLLVTFVNHSTILLQQNGLNILTDPVWSRRASPFTFAGPRRRRDPGVRWEDVPPIDIVLLSHNHYDHLDLTFVGRLAGRRQSEFIVPSGVASFLRSRNVDPLHELDWGQSVTLGQTTIHSVPALHFSGRGLFDRNRTLWCGYVIEAAGRGIYFAGDTGFGDHFARIRERFGPLRLALLPVGAYQPQWFMSPVHMGPEEALRAHEILNPGASIAIHHGTFQLGDDGPDTPKRRLMELGRPDSFLILNNGQSVALP